jgi:hypothetical protein
MIQWIGQTDSSLTTFTPNELRIPVLGGAVWQLRRILAERFGAFLGEFRKFISVEVFQ